MKRLLLLSIPILTLLLGCPPPAQNYPVLSNASTASMESGIAVAIVLDTSGSMSGQPLQDVKGILLNNILTKLEFYNLANDSLDVALIDCGGAGVIIEMDRFNGENFRSTVEGLNSGGGTPLGYSTFLAYEQLAKSNREERHIFILTDGASSDYDPAVIVNQMASKGGDTVAIHLVGFRAAESYYAGIKQAGAQVVTTENPSALNDTCDLVFKGILKLEADD